MLTSHGVRGRDRIGGSTRKNDDKVTNNRGVNSEGEQRESDYG